MLESYGCPCTYMFVRHLDEAETEAAETKFLNSVVGYTSKDQAINTKFRKELNISVPNKIIKFRSQSK
jgi:hypothetical protein